MPRYNLPALARRQRNIRRKSIALREIAMPSMLATDLYRACYKPVIDLWTAALPRIEDAYARTIAQMTTDSPADVSAQIDGAAEQVNRLLLILTPDLRDWALRVESRVRSAWRGAVLSATGIDLQTMLGPEETRATLETYTSWNADLIRDVSAQIKQRVSNEVFSGLSQRKPAREVAKSIREATGLGRDRSLRIASDQLSKLSGQLAQERRREAGLSVFAWHHSRKAHPRQDHVIRDGLLYSEDASLLGKRVDGKVIHAAPPADDRAGMKPFCGCRERSVMVFSFDGED